MNKRRPVVHFPSQLEQENYYGELYGFHHPDSNEYNVVALNGEAFAGAVKLGKILLPDAANTKAESSELVGIRTETGLKFRIEGKTCQKKPYDTIQNIFSRNSGILETEVMLDKCAIIAGCGSVGSLVALELARAGVGHFVLIDNDTVAYHNLCRHQCGIQDVGKFKVDAVKERILQINPHARVTVYPSIVERVPKEIFEQSCDANSIMIGAADSRDGDRWAAQVACIYKIPFISIGLWKRASVGEIFYFIPGEMPCYACAFQGSISSNKVEQDKRFYVGEEEKAQTIFEPGISVDIGYVTLIGVKLIIDLLNCNTPGYLPKVIHYLSQFTLICNTNDPRLGGEEVEIFSHPLQVTTSIEVNYLPPCSPCQCM